MMIRNKNNVGVVAGVVALLAVAPAWAEASAVQKQTATRTLKRLAVNKKPHQLILQVNTNDAAMMNLALNNATNVAQHYSDMGEEVAIEVVTFGPGLHMLRDDTSPVKTRIKAISLSTPAISFKACGNTKENMSKAENREIPLISEATVVKSGVVRVMELEEQGWTYVKP
jgi:intracellular sulfur oxidation DsrE/DsrF family protein